MLRNTFIAASCFLLGICAAGAEEAGIFPRAMTPIDMVELTRLSAPALSPDGQTLLYLRSETDWAENSVVRRYRMIDLTTGEALAVFEPEDAEESFDRAYWAPDSSGFVTLLEREDDDAQQAYFYDISSGVLARLTEHEEDVESVIWAPDGGVFYFLADRTPGEEIKKLRRDRWMIREYEQRQQKDIWRYDVAAGKTERILGGDDFIRRYSLSRDGEKIIYMRAPGGLRDDVHDGELWLFDIASGDQTRLTRNRYSEASPQLSPDNSAFAYIATVNASGEQYYEDNLFVQHVGDDTPQLLFPDEAIEVQSFAWDAEGAGLYVLGNIGLRTELFYYFLQDEELRRLTTGDHAINDWDYAAGTGIHSAIITNAHSPGEIYLMRGAERAFQPVTDEHASLRQRFDLPEQEAVSWRGRRGVEIEGLLVYPLNYQEGTRFPLVVITHGGPRSSSQFGSWNYSRYLPVLAGQGYGVLLPNHRGGTGYGDAFMRDMVGGYFTNAHHDVMDGVDAMIERGLADPDRLIKMGWSAGGHMTNKIITVTDRFAAASSGAGASDWVSMYGESDVRFNRTPWFGGAPWEKNAPLRSYARQSMLKDAWRVTTPTLFLVGGNDVRVPPTQSILMYRGVKAAGAETALYVAPGEPHGFRKPSHRLFKINTELAWYARHVLGTIYTPALPDAAFEENDAEEERGME